MSKQTFDFSEALRRMKLGKKVSRKIFCNCYVIDEGKIKVGFGGDPLKIWTPRDFSYNEDILATDWEEVEE